MLFLKDFSKFSFHNICVLMHPQIISQKIFPKGVTAWSALEKPKMFKLKKPMCFFHMTMDSSFHNYFYNPQVMMTTSRLSYQLSGCSDCHISKRSHNSWRRPCMLVLFP